MLVDPDLREHHTVWPWVWQRPDRQARKPRVVARGERVARRLGPGRPVEAQRQRDVLRLHAADYLATEHTSGDDRLRHPQIKERQFERRSGKSGRPPWMRLAPPTVP